MLDPELIADCPYGPGGLLIDDVSEIDVPGNRVVARMPTHADLPLTREQRAHPLRHPSHVNGGLMVHMTGMVGFVHFYCITGLRHRDGWVGYGGRIKTARFRAIAPPGEPLFIECKGLSERRSSDKILSVYAFRCTQAGKLIYDAEHTALWMKVT